MGRPTSSPQQVANHAHYQYLRLPADPISNAFSKPSRNSPFRKSGNPVETVWGGSNSRGRFMLSATTKTVANLKKEGPMAIEIPPHPVLNGVGEGTALTETDGLPVHRREYILNE